jgi:hypothetical protein
MTPRETDEIKGPPGEDAGQPSGAKEAPGLKPEPETETSDLMRKTPKHGSEDAVIDDQWLRRRSTGELVDNMARLAQELKTRLGKETVAVHRPGGRLEFRDVLESEIGDFVRLPDVSQTKRAVSPAKTWRLVLISSDPEQEPLGLEIVEEIVVGRASGSAIPHLDLSRYGAERAGVSRRHALLKPTKEGLFLTDLSSMNGTFCNEERVEPRASRPLKDNDTVAFGTLHFKLKIVRRPRQ